MHEKQSEIKIRFRLNERTLIKFFVYLFMIFTRMWMRKESWGTNFAFGFALHHLHKHTRLVLFKLNWQKDEKLKCLTNENICWQDFSEKSDFLFAIVIVSLIPYLSAINNRYSKVERREEMILFDKTISNIHCRVGGDQYLNG